MKTPGTDLRGADDVWRSDCCGAPVVILRSDTSVFDYCSQEPSKELEAELESHDVSEGSEFWMDDYVRIHHHACAKCREFIDRPWIEEELDHQRELRDFVATIGRMTDSEDADDCVMTVNLLILKARRLMADLTGNDHGTTLPEPQAADKLP